MLENNKLPKDWKLVKLGDIVTLSSQKHSPVKPEYIFYIGLEHIEKHTGKLTSKVGLEKITTIKNKFSKGDILYGKLRPNLNKVYLSKEEGVCSTDILVLKLSEECIGKYLHPIMFSTTFVNKMSDNTSGVNLPRVSTKFILNYEIPLPPLETQQAIVSKIEELFSELDKGIEDLKTAQQQLKTYRQSVLKYAFEGKKRILFETIVESSQNGLSKRSGSDGEEFNVLRLADIKNNIIVIDNPRKIRMTSSEIVKYKLNENDLVCIRVNGSKDLVGKLVFITNNDDKNKWAYCDHFIRFTLKINFSSKFIHYYFQTIEVRKFIHDNMVTSAGQNTVSQVTIKNIFVPDCILEEQHRIIQEIESRLSVADKMEESIAQSLQQAEALRQSILKKAFKGEPI
ncbi:MAG: restriction endonuclease subunit S [Flavobacterium sp.]|nr:restriction endonuclease subunit S [Flavobacterium sp.]